MKTEIHPAESRGHANHGWLQSAHTFSFANYYNPKRMHFGALRVLNDDRVAPGMGFGTHPHDNMEIISIPLSGTLAHKDSMGHQGYIQKGEIQVMSAGAGIRHSEMNGSREEEVSFLQIWVMPNQKNVAPRYDQIRLDESELKKNFVAVIGSAEQPAKTWIHQDVRFSLGYLDAGIIKTYNLSKKTNGVYIFMIEGDAEVAGENLSRRDGLAIVEADTINILATSDARILIMDIPLQVSSF